MQPPFSRWFNPDKRCDVIMGSSTISSEQLQELQELSPKVGEQETSGVCEGGYHWLYYPPNIFRITCDRKCLAKHRYCQKSWFKNGDELSIILLWNSAFLFWDHISSFTETCLIFVSLLFWNQRMFSILFWQNILIKLQHAMKVNQSWRLKVFWLQKWLDAWKWHEVIKQFWTHTSWNWAAHHIAKF
jgi:hypothetical protein